MSKRISQLSTVLATILGASSVLKSFRRANALQSSLSHTLSSSKNNLHDHCDYLNTVAIPMAWAEFYPIHREKKPLFAMKNSIKSNGESNIYSPPPLNDLSNIERIFAISDLHTDNDMNMSWLANRCSNIEQNHLLSDTPGPKDLLIIAGDISHDCSVLKESLNTITRNLKCTVFFIPGNHEAWIGGESMNDKKITDSLQKLELISRLCREIDLVEVEEKLVGGAHQSPVWLVPIHGWYDGTLSLSDCQDLCQDFGSFPWTDFARCNWPRSKFPPYKKDHPNGRIPRGLVNYFIEQNESVLDRVRPSFETQSESHTSFRTKSGSFTTPKPRGLITFSHFLPTEKVLPDWKNVESNEFLRDEWLDHGAGGISAKFAKVAGSSLLDDQIRSILPSRKNQVVSVANDSDQNNDHHDPDSTANIESKSYRHLHVFGHSHRPKDVTISNIRYIHNPLGKPSEREMQMISPNVDFQLIWDCTSKEGEVVAKEDIIRYWEEKGGGKEALKRNLERRRKKRREVLRAIMEK